ncbi:TonB-dependent receptor [Chromobacterium haemolyticum]|nr:TonB-dependent receptor [Chromobacterium haemolyticum]
MYSADFKVSKEVLQLPAGMMAVALGVEARKEKLSHDYNYDVSKDAVGLGMDAAKSAAGQRNINALFAEADIPVVKNLDAQLALRYDRYSDFGSSVNPKVALRYQPLPQLMFRSSASTGFRAPSLYDVNQPNQVVNTAQGFYDPTYCPNGVAQPGAGPKACDGTLQRNLMTGGNKSLSPEKSSSLSFGIVIEPVKNLTASADFWWTMIHDTIGTVDEAVLLDPANAAKYASLMNRDAKNDLNYISSQTMNLGTTSASGIDLKVSWTSPRTSVGTFNIGLDGTYMTKYQYQVEKGGAYHNSLGVFIDTAPTFRWQHKSESGSGLGARGLERSAGTGLQVWLHRSGSVTQCAAVLHLELVRQLRLGQETHVHSGRAKSVRPRAAGQQSAEDFPARIRSALYRSGWPRLLCQV